MGKPRYDRALVMIERKTWERMKKYAKKYSRSTGIRQTYISIVTAAVDEWLDSHE